MSFQSFVLRRLVIASVSNTKKLPITVSNGPGARFSKVLIISGPGKLSPFTLKIEVSIVLHLT